MQKFKKHSKTVLYILAATALSLIALIQFSCVGSPAEDPSEQVKSYVSEVNAALGGAEEYTQGLEDAISQDNTAAVKRNIKSLKEAYGAIEEIEIDEDNNTLKTLKEKYSAGAKALVESLDAYEKIYLASKNADEVDDEDLKELQETAASSYEDALEAFEEADKVTKDATKSKIETLKDKLAAGDAKDDNK